MFDRAIVAGQRSALPLRGDEEGRAGAFGLDHGARRQPLVAQRPIPELVLRPIFPVEAVRRAQRPANQRCADRRGYAEQPPLVSIRRAHVDRLRADRRRAPRSSPQAGAVVARQVHESFRQKRTKPVPTFEVPTDPAQAQGERLRGEVPARRADQKAAQAENAMQVPFPRFPVPADPGVPRREALRGRGESDSPQPAMRRVDQVAQPAADMARRSPRMLARGHLGPQEALVRRFHRNRPKSRNPTDPLRNVRRQRNGLPEPSQQTAAAAMARLRQLDQPGCVEFAQRDRATRLPQTSASVADPQRFADPAGQLRATAFLIGKPVKPRPSFLGTQRALTLLVHRLGERKVRKKYAQPCGGARRLRASRLRCAAGPNSSSTAS